MGEVLTLLSRPTGGYHQSGIGKDLGRQAVEANLRLKSVLMDFTEVH